jgi:hypothetical protein
MAHPPALFLWIVRKQALYFSHGRVIGSLAATIHDAANRDKGRQSRIPEGNSEH